MPPKPNILMLVSDSTRPGWLGCYGGRPGITPHLDRLASRAWLFERAYSASTWTAPAVAALLTGMMPGVVQIRLSPSPAPGVIHNDRLPAGLETLPENLGRSGYATAILSANPLLHAHYRITHGFEIRHDLFQAPAEVLIDRWEEVRTRLPEPWLACLHFMDCHHPLRIQPVARQSGLDFEKYKQSPNDQEIHLKYFRKRLAALTEDDRRALEALYLGEMAYLDSQLARLFEVHRNDLLLFTADHGEMLAEKIHHPALLPKRPIGIGHAKPPYEGLIRVPFILQRPGEDSPHRVSELVSLVDWSPTLLELLGLPAPSDRIQGRSFAGLFHDRPAPRDHVVAERLEDNYLPAHEIAVVTERWKYIQFAAPVRHTGSSRLDPPWHTVDRTFGHRLQLLGWTGRQTQVAAGDTLRLTLYWKALVPLKPNLLGMMLFVHQRDRSVPFCFPFFSVHGLHRPMDWIPGQVVEDPLCIPVPVDAPKGTYALQVGLRDLDVPESAEFDRRFIDGVHTVGLVEIGAPAPSALADPLPPLPLPRRWRIRLGFPTHFRMPMQEVPAGGRLEFHLRWYREFRRDAFRWILLRLSPVEGGNRPVDLFFQARNGVVDPAAPAEAGHRDEQVMFRLPGWLPTGRYDLQVAVLPRRRMALIRPLVLATGKELAVLPPKRSVSDFAGVDWVGCDCPWQCVVPGERFVVRLYWSALSPPTAPLPEFFLRLESPSDGTVLRQPFRLEIPAIPLLKWPDCHIGLTEIPLDLPAGFAPGPCDLSLGSDANPDTLPVYRIDVGHPEQIPPEILREELYDLREDPGETVDLSVGHPTEVAHLRALAAGQRADNIRRSRLYFGRGVEKGEAEPEEIRRQLAALGYTEEEP